MSEEKSMEMPVPEVSPKVVTRKKKEEVDFKVRAIEDCFCMGYRRSAGDEFVVPAEKFNAAYMEKI